MVKRGKALGEARYSRTKSAKRQVDLITARRDAKRQSEKKKRESAADENATLRARLADLEAENERLRQQPLSGCVYFKCELGDDCICDADDRAALAQTKESRDE